MTGVAEITLENEMDLILAYKKSIRVGDLLGLTISTQTAFATAVSEVCREVIDKAFDGMVKLGTTNDGNRFFFTAEVGFAEHEDWKNMQEGMEYARKLVPIFESERGDGRASITLKLGIPRSAGVDMRKISFIKAQVEREGPTNAYEEVKQKNAELSRVKLQHELALVNANYLNKQKDEFLSIASHELNSPLTVLRSLAQLALKAEGGKDASVNAFLKKIELQSTKLKMMIQQLLDKTKIESGHVDYIKEKLDFNTLLGEIVDLYRPVAAERAFDTQFGTTCWLYVDKLRIEQVLSNLLANAAKYSLAPAPITISTELSENEAIVHVKDMGVGLSEEEISMVFEKFYRSEHVQNKYSGLGMGLYIASMIVAAHDGTIWVTSEPGQGTTFSFSLPIAN